MIKKQDALTPAQKAAMPSSVADISKYQDQVERIINANNVNCGLMAMFNDIRAVII